MTTAAATPPGTLGGSRDFLVVTLTGLAAWLVFVLWTPAGDAESSICLFRRLLFPCPGCGMTRAVAHLAKGELVRAWALHPMAVLLFAEAIVLWLAWALLQLRGADLSATRLGGRWWGALGLTHAALFFLVWTFRLATGRLPW